MRTNWLTAIQPTIEATLRAYGVPGVVIAAARGRQPAAVLALGGDGEGWPLAADTLFPVASITKLGTALAALRLVDAGRLALDDPLARHLPASTAARAGVTPRHLLAHTSGLGPEESLPWAAGLTWPAIARAALAAEPGAAPGTRVAYSNHNSSLLALVVERLTDRPFPAALAEWVLAPLGVEGYLGVDPPRRLAVIAGLEGSDVAALAAPGGCRCGHPGASLVTTAAGALALVRAFAGVPVGFLEPDTRAAATRDQTGGLPGGPWGLGPELLGRPHPHRASPYASAVSFGHTGGAGGIAWADPAAGVAWAILPARGLDRAAGRTFLSGISAAVLAAA